MPVDFPQYDGDGNVRPVLRAYLAAVHRFLSEIVATGKDYKGMPLFIEELVPSMRLAWEQMGPHFGATDRAIVELTDDSINRHGLYGPQLTFKLQNVEVRNRAFRTAGGFGPFRSLIASIDTLLKSILGAAGAGTAIEEIKDYIGHSTRE